MNARKYTLCSTTLALFLFACPLWAQLKTESFQEQDVVAREVLVKFKTGQVHTIAQAISEIRFTHDIDVIQEVGSGKILRLHSRSRDAATLVEELSARPDVEYAEPDFIVHAITIPNDPSFGGLWGLQNTGQTIQGVPGKPGADIGATSAWSLSTGSRANVVVVVDTGIDYNHPDLATNVWSAPNAFTVNIGGAAITCPAGSHGFNAITNTCNPLDDNQHGTHVSGTIGAVGNNNLGVVGVNWTAAIMGAKFLDSTGIGSTSNAINAIEFAIQAKRILGTSANVRVLSNSWGCSGSACFSQALLDEINSANSNDMLFVAAAGNNGSNNDITPFYPASYNAPNVIAVAATDNTDSRPSFSNFGASSVHLGAPGVNVLSTFPGGNYGFLSGTSMAAPHVSGAAALVLSSCALNTAALKGNILNNVDPISSMSGITVTGGRLNVNRSINACAPGFSLTASPDSLSINNQDVGSTNISIVPANGFNGNVNLAASGLPSGVKAIFFNNSPATGTEMELNVRFAKPGSYTITIIGTSGNLVNTVDITLTVNGPGMCGVIAC